MTLLDEEKSVEQKTDETLMVASRWEECPPIASTKNLHEVVGGEDFGGRNSGDGFGG